MNTREAEQLIQELFDGTISEADSCRLEEELVVKPELTSIYRDYALLHNHLLSSEHEQSIPDLLEQPGFSEPIANPSSISKFRPQRILATAATLALGALLGYLVWQNRVRTTEDPASSPAFLTFQTSQGSKFVVVTPSDQQADNRDTAPNTILAGSTFQLSQGAVRLEFLSGVTGIITAPARFTLLHGKSIKLARGSAHFDVPPGGEGFQVLTPGLRLTDWGTQFDVLSFPGSTDEVHVREGKVEVESLFGQKERRFLTTEESARNTETGELQMLVAGKPYLPTTLPDNLYHFHFPFEKTPEGDLGVSGNHPSLPSLEVKVIQSNGRSVEDRFVSGPFGDALYFDGQGDIVTTNWPGIYGESPVTISLWAYYEDSGLSWGALVGWGLGKYDTDTQGLHQWKILLAPAIESQQRFLKCAFGRKTYSQVFTGHQPRNWHHYAIVYTGETEPASESSLRFYLDGKLANPDQYFSPTPPQRPTDLATAKALIMGDSLSSEIPFGSRYFHGAIDELYIIEGALTDEQIQALAEKNRFP